MNFVAAFMAVFSMLGAIDLIFGNRFGLGKEFEKGFMLLGTMALSMVGMIILAPYIGTLLTPVFQWIYTHLHLDPSVLPGMLLANDMGGASLALTVGKDPLLAGYNGLVVSTMMGCTVSFTIPFALGVVGKEKHPALLLGLLCGVVTIPIGCVVAGLVCGLSMGTVLLNAIPMLLLSAGVAAGLWFFPRACVKVFGGFGYLVKALVLVGLALGVWRFLTGMTVLPGLDTLENGMMICLNAAAVMSGAFPFMALVSRLLKKPIGALGQYLGVNGKSAFGFFSSLATSMTTFQDMNDMDDKGATLNAAFAVSAAFTFAGHLAFTLAFEPTFLLPMIIGKLTAGVAGLALATVIYRRTAKQEEMT